MVDDKCPNCNGSGAQPDGWTLSQARENPKGFNEHRLEAQHGPNHGMVSLLNVVSPLQFLDNGQERCVLCSGTGVNRETTARKIQAEKEARLQYFKDLFGSDAVIECPEGQMFLVIGAYFNDSDGMSDYYAPHRGLAQCYVIALKKKGPRTEKAVRTIVDSIPELAKLKWTWNKEDWSGGHGTWLQSAIVGDYPYRCYDGRERANYWYEISFELYTRAGYKSKFFVDSNAPVKPVSIPAEVTPVSCTNVEIRRNLEKNGIELVFPGKPAPEVIGELKVMGFRWSNPQKIWWKKFDEETMKKVQEMFASAA